MPTAPEAIVIDAADAFTPGTGVFDLPVHPLATVNGMMTEDELQDLADDIAAHGLRHPLVMYEGQLLDGRNRREACRRAGVIPDVVELDPSKDPVALVLSLNNHRRHRTEGARAMAIALMDRIVSHGGRREKGVSQQVFPKNLLSPISMARLVIREAPELVEGVKNGASLKQAYDTARLRQRQRDECRQRLDDLRRRSPDYAAKVDAREWSVAKALDVVYREDLARHQHDVLREQQAAITRLVEADEPPRPLDFDTVQAEAPGDREVADAQQAVLGILTSIASQLAELKARPPLAGWWQETYTHEVQAKTRSIIASAKAIEKAHQPLVAREEVRRMAEQDQVRARQAARRAFEEHRSQSGISL